jgi:regulator of RNase E activity RraA
MRFQYFSRGAVASHAYSRIVRVGIPINVLGLAIKPQDLLHGDENGLILVPKEGLEKLPQAVDAVRTKERALMEFMRGPDFSLDRLKHRFAE